MCCKQKKYFFHQLSIVVIFFLHISLCFNNAISEEIIDSKNSKIPLNDNNNSGSLIKDVIDEASNKINKSINIFFSPKINVENAKQINTKQITAFLIIFIRFFLLMARQLKK